MKVSWRLIFFKNKSKWHYENVGLRDGNYVLSMHGYFYFCYHSFITDIRSLDYIYLNRMVREPLSRVSLYKKDQQSGYISSKISWTEKKSNRWKVGDRILYMVSVCRNQEASCRLQVARAPHIPYAIGRGVENRASRSSVCPHSASWTHKGPR